MINNFSGDHEFLSNFYPSRVSLDVDIIEYPTVEHAYQAAKTYDRDTRLKIARAETPGKAKKLGKKVSLRPDWESIKVEIMRDLLLQKFARGTFLANKLIETGDEELIEGNTWGDTFWGTYDGIGENHLGKLIMEIRKELRTQKEVPIKDSFIKN